MTATDTVREAISNLRRQADALESLLLNDPEAVSDISADGKSPVFDPDADEPPVKPDVAGNREQEDWCALMLWGRLRALNVRQARGATPEESREIAKAAGYKDGRGWNAWDLGWEKDSDGSRHFTEDGMRHLRHYYAKVGRSLPDDLA